MRIFISNFQVRAAEIVCATAQIEIPQTASLERQAFEARMSITNTPDGLPLDPIVGALKVADELCIPLRSLSTMMIARY